MPLTGPGPKPVHAGRGPASSLRDTVPSERCCSDEVSLAFDVIMANGIDGKGAILTRLSEFWFTLLPKLVPGLHTHFLSSGVPDQLKRSMPSADLRALDGRCLEVKRTKVLPIESIVRGYITGSAWSSYQVSGTVCDMPLPPGLQESEKLERPLWTPSTKAEVGGTDVNISPGQGDYWPLSVMLQDCQTGHWDVANVA